MLTHYHVYFFQFGLTWSKSEEIGWLNRN